MFNVLNSLVHFVTPNTTVRMVGALRSEMEPFALRVRDVIGSLDADGPDLVGDSAGEP